MAKSWEIKEVSRLNFTDLLVSNLTDGYLFVKRNLPEASSPACSWKQVLHLPSGAIHSSWSKKFHHREGMCMFDFLSRGRSKPSTHTAASHPPPHPKLTTPPSAAQREMVRLTLHSVLRHNGIPGNWLTCEITPIQIIAQGDAVLVQLVVLKWHDALMQYAPALQLGMLQELKQFDPNANAAKYHFSWSFAPDCGRSQTQFPEPGFWSTGLATHLAPIQPFSGSPSMPAATPPLNKSKFDLPLTAADLHNTDEDDDDHGFAATQINDI